MSNCQLCWSARTLSSCGMTRVELAGSQICLFYVCMYEGIRGAIILVSGATHTMEELVCDPHVRVLPCI